MTIPPVKDRLEDLSLKLYIDVSALREIQNYCAYDEPRVCVEKVKELSDWSLRKIAQVDIDRNGK